MAPFDDQDEEIEYSSWHRKNGFQCPWSGPQLFIIGVYTLNILVMVSACLYLKFSDIYLDSELAILIALDIVVFIMAFITIKKDPTDPVSY